MQNGTERRWENSVENTVKTGWERCKTALRDAAKMGGKGIKWHRKGIKRGRKGTKHHRNGMKLHWKAAKMGWKSYKLADFKRKGEILTFSSQNTLAQGRHLDILLKLGFFYSILIEQWYFGGKWADVMARCGDFGDTWGPWGLCSALLHLESYFLLTHHHKWAEMGIVWATFWASFLKTESRHHDGISRAISTIFFPKFSQHRWQTLRFFFSSKFKHFQQILIPIALEKALVMTGSPEGWQPPAPSLHVGKPTGFHPKKPTEKFQLAFSPLFPFPPGFYGSNK